MSINVCFNNKSLNKFINTYKYKYLGSEDDSRKLYFSNSSFDRPLSNKNNICGPLHKNKTNNLILNILNWY